MEANTEGSFIQGPADVLVELSAAEAAQGTAKTIAAPPDGMPVTIYFPPGARDGMVQNVGVPWVDRATGTASMRNLAVAVRVRPATAARPRFGTGARITAVALGIALIAGIFLVPTLFRGAGAGSAATTTTATTTTATRPAEAVAPTTPPLDPAAFQRSLDEADKQLTGAVDNLRRATTPRAVAGAADGLAEVVRTQASMLSGLTAPPAVGAAHDGLVSALSSLESELGSVSGAAESRSVCTGGSASAALSRAGAAEDLRAAVTALAAADPGAKYRFGSFLPAVTQDQNRRKANASYLTRTTGGSGQLKIDNGNTVDTVVSLVKVGSKKPAASVYLHGRKKVTTNRIKDGTYEVFVSSGADWDGKRFARDCRFSKFDSSLKFTTTSRQYTIWEISLKAVLGGNATSSEVDPDAFPS